MKISLHSTVHLFHLLEVPFLVMVLFVPIVACIRSYMLGGARHTFQLVVDTLAGVHSKMSCSLEVTMGINDHLGGVVSTSC